MAESPVKYRDEVLCYTVYGNGKAVGGKYRLVSASVRLGVNRVGKATLCFEAGEVAERGFEEADDDVFKPGSGVRLDVGRREEEKTVFEGSVTGLSLDIRPGQRSQLVVECRDEGFTATLVRRNKVFEEMKDSEIIAEVLGAYGTVEVEDTGFKHASLVQYYATDWDFALSRADANGLLVVCREGKIFVQKPQVTAEPVLTVTYGVDLIDFSGGVSATEQVAAVEAIAWDPASQEVQTVVSAKPSLNVQGNIKSGELAGAEKLLLQTDAPADPSALQAWADGVALRTGLARFRGSFRFHGSAAVVPGCVIELAGLGERFNGNAFIGSVEHEIRHHVWTTKAEMGVSPEGITEEPDVVAPPASGWLPGVEGLHVGKVKQLNEDPAREQRILVELPLLNGDKNEVWARWVQPYAGNGAGSFFVPEAGDEVVLGFFNQDPGHPVVLGSLYSSKQLPPYELTAENDTKAIVSREKLKLEFDEEKKVITLLTPGGNNVMIDDDGKQIKLADEHGNEIVMDQDGIVLNSAGKIVLKAKKDISGEATGKLSLKAKQDVELDGMNVKATAKTGFTASGNATAELSASGQTTVKGGMVMIN